MAKTKKISTWWYIIPPGFLSFITTLFYLPSLRYPFLFDDLPQIAKNHEIKFTSAKKLFFSNPRWLSKIVNHYTFKYWKLNILAYRIINLIIHLLAGILLFYLIILLCKNISPKKTDKIRRYLKKNYLFFATVMSTLFLLHPAQTQTATYITQIRLEGFVAIFSFATMIFFILATKVSSILKSAFFYLICAILMIFGAGSKEIIVVLPLLLMLIDWFFLSEGETLHENKFLKRIPIHLTLALILYYTYLKLGSPVQPEKVFTLQASVPNNRGNALTKNPEELITPLKFFISQFKVMLHYIKIFFWPFGLSFDYGWKIPKSFWDYDSILPFITLVGIFLTSLFLFIRNTKNIFCFCVGWFFIVTLPRSSIIPSTELVCDYKTYFSSIGPLFLIGLATTELKSFFFSQLNNSTFFRHPPAAHPENRQSVSAAPPSTTLNKIFSTIFIFILSLVLGISTYSRNKIWRSSLYFWKDVIKKTKPTTPARAYNNYAVALVREGKQKKAIRYFEKAVKVDNTYAEPIINLALQYQSQKEFYKSLKLYKHAMTLKHVHPELYNNLGLLHLSKKDFLKAEKAFKIAIKLNGSYGKAFFNLAQTYQQQNKLEEALECYEKAAQGNMFNIDFYYTHGIISTRLKKHEKAIKSLEFVERHKKNYKNTRNLLAILYYQTNRNEKAEPLFNFIRQQNPNNPRHNYNHAQTLLRLKKYSQALELYQKVENLDLSKNNKKFPHVPLHIIKCLHHTGKKNTAKKELVHFIQNAPTPILKQMGVQLLKELSHT